MEPLPIAGYHFGHPVDRVHTADGFEEVRCALSIERRTRPVRVHGTGGLMSQQDDDTTIRLEGRYISAGPEPTPLTLRCGLVTYREAAFRETKGAGGSVMRSVIEQPSLMVSGLPTTFDQLKGDWTHVVSARLPNGEGELVSIMPLTGNRARFVMKFGS
jgi:hypothetical protein